MANQPNVVFILADQLRFDYVGCYGHPVAITPNLDRLAEQGVRFTNCYSANPVCLPSRSTMVTGQYCHQHHVHLNQHILADTARCFPAAFRDANYLTACVGKLHLWQQWYQVHTNVDHGFQVMQTVEGKHSLSNRVEESRDYYDFLADRNQPQPRQFAREPDYHEKLLSWASEYDADHHVDGFITQRAERIIEDSGRLPFFLWVGLCSPHDPFDPPQQFLDLYRDVEIPDPVFDPKATAAKGPDLQAFQKQITKRCGLPSTDWSDATVRDRIRDMRRHYLANITYVDHLVGRIMQALERKGIVDDTIVVFLSDHGDFQGDHGCVNKGPFMYETSVHVPLIIRAPGVSTAGGTADGLAQTTDLYATLLALAGIEETPPRSSRSLVPMLRSPETAVRHSALTETLDRRMIRCGDEKLIFDGEAEGLELYNLADDPTEQRNLARDPSDPAKLTGDPQVLQRIAELFVEHGRLVAECETHQEARPPRALVPTVQRPRVMQPA